MNKDLIVPVRDPAECVACEPPHCPEQTFKCYKESW